MQRRRTPVRVDVAKDLWAFAQYVNATTESELDKAADHLAKAIMTVGLDVILGILTKKAAGKVSRALFAHRRCGCNGDGLQSVLMN